MTLALWATRMLPEERCMRIYFQTVFERPPSGYVAHTRAEVVELVGRIRDVVVSKENFRFLLEIVELVAAELHVKVLSTRGLLEPFEGYDLLLDLTTKRYYLFFDLRVFEPRNEPPNRDAEPVKPKPPTAPPEDPDPDNKLLIGGA